MLSPTSPAPYFNGWRIPSTSAGHAAITSAIDLALHHESTSGVRERARNAAAQASFVATLTALLSDVTYRHLAGSTHVLIARSARVRNKRSRYRSDLSGRQIINALDLLTDTSPELLGQDVAERCVFGVTPSRIHAGPALIALLDGLTIFDFTTRHGEEVIVSKGEKRGRSPSELIEYTDNDKTNALREQVRQINAARAALVIGLGDAPAFSPERIDPRDILVKRYFTRGSFTSGGRIFDTWFMNAPKEFRLRCTINGERVVSLDYSGMAVRLAYASIKTALPDGDPYTIPGLSRPVAKQLLNACLCASRNGKPLTRWPEDMVKEVGALKFAHALRALQLKHPALVPLMFRGAGHALQFTESTILVDVLLQLIAKGVPALSVHDCVVVPRSHLSDTRAVMLSTFERHTGAPTVVSEEIAAAASS